MFKRIGRIDRGATVNTMDGELGRLLWFVVDPDTDRLAHIVVQPSAGGDELIIPTDMIEELDSIPIKLGLNNDSLNSIHDDLRQYEPGYHRVNPSDVEALEVDTSNGQRLITLVDMVEISPSYDRLSGRQTEPGARPFHNARLGGAPGNGFKRISSGPNDSMQHALPAGWAARASDETDVRIGIWGGTSSGKTTFLGALSIAALLDDLGRWKVNGQDTIFPGSTNFANDRMNDLMDGVFPPPTTGQPSDYGFNISGTLHRDRLRNWAREGSLSDRSMQILKRLAGRPVSFGLHVRDYPGDTFLETDADDEIWEYLADCHGIIYLFDPERERNQNSRERNRQYLFKSINFLRNKVASRGRLENTVLPHFLSVCVTKFDDPYVFGALQQEGMLFKMPNGVLYVRNAEKAFEHLADKVTVRMIQNNFDPKRIEYFMTSSIGFKADELTVVRGAHAENYSRYVNVTGTGADKQIIGEVRPLNVLEPLLSIYTQEMSSRARAR